MAGLSCVGGRDTKTQLITYQEILGDLSNTSYLNNNSNFDPHVFYSIKNVSQMCHPK